MSRIIRSSATLVAAALLVTAGATTPVPAEPDGGQDGLEYSFTPPPRPKAHRAGVIKVVVKGLPANRKVKVRIQRRAADFSELRSTSKRFSRTATLRAGQRHVFCYKAYTGHYYVVGKPVSVKGTVYKAHKARILVSSEHGVRVKLRYYKKGHKHHPVPGVNAPAKGSDIVPMPSDTGSPTTPPTGGTPTTPPQSSTPPPAIAYPSTSRGAAGSFDRGQGAWKQCKITWSFDPGPTARLGADPQTELQLLRGIFNSIEDIAKYDFEEVQGKAQLTVQMLDTVQAVGGIVPSGVTIPVPQDGSPFTSATIQFNGNGLLGTQQSRDRIEVRQNLYAHEIGHALGLNHVNDPTQIMNPAVPNDYGWGAGDVAALKAMPSTCP